MIGAALVTISIAAAVAPLSTRDLLSMTIRAFTGQRCGTAVDLGSGYAHPACHLKAAFHPSSGRTGTSTITGGWHDAGDYGRYVVNSSITMATLLWAHELFHADVLDEVRWNLDWMTQMQDADGGVWHKQTSESFPPFVMPQDDHSTSYVIGKSSCATADFAAVMAMSARIYRNGRYLDAARRAFAWVDAHPNVTFRNPPGITTGEYGDRDCSDERLWAAAELWRTSGDQTAGAYLRLHRFPVEVPDWHHVGTLAAWAYAFSGNGDKAVIAGIRRRTVAAADESVRRARAHPYRVPLRTRDYVWGSNGVAANYGVLLLMANQFHPDRVYVDATLDILHYLLGHNPYGLSWVTGAGTNSVKHPHHRPSGSDGIEAPWPGLLAGGPNRHRQDPVLRATQKMYADDQESFASNEVAINWNAALVFILAGVQEAK